MVHLFQGMFNKSETKFNLSKPTLSPSNVLGMVATNIE